MVVIAGHIGGRGVAYHDLKHQRILTDMYTAQEVFNDKIVTQHCELVVQCLGRLNTIYTGADEKRPRVRLWASNSVHDLHKLYLREIRKLSDSVQKHGNYKEAFKERPKWVTGCRPGGDDCYLPMSRPAFRKDDEKMRNADKIPAPLPSRRNRGLRQEQDVESDYPFPEGDITHCECKIRMPQSAGLQEEQAENRNRYLWTEGSGDDWNNDDHKLFEVKIPLGFLDSSCASRYLEHNPGLIVEKPGNTLPDQLGRGVFKFKFLRAARGIIMAGAAGDVEKGTFNLLYNLDASSNDEGGCDGGDGAAGGSGNATLASEGSSGNNAQNRKRPRHAPR